MSIILSILPKTIPIDICRGIYNFIHGYNPIIHSPFEIGRRATPTMIDWLVENIWKENDLQDAFESCIEWGNLVAVKYLFDKVICDSYCLSLAIMSNSLDMIQLIDRERFLKYEYANHIDIIIGTGSLSILKYFSNYHPLKWHNIQRFLCAAIEQENIDMVKFLLVNRNAKYINIQALSRYIAVVNLELINTIMEFKNYSSHVLIYVTDLETARFLVDQWDAHPHLFCEQMLLKNIETGNIKVFDYLVSEGADPIDCECFDQLIIAAIQSRSFMFIRRLCDLYPIEKETIFKNLEIQLDPLTKVGILAICIIYIPFMRSSGIFKYIYNESNQVLTSSEHEYLYTLSLRCNQDVISNYLFLVFQ